VGHILSRDHPLVPARLRYTYELLEAYGAFRLEEARLVTPRQATTQEVGAFHTPAYVEAVRGLSQSQGLDQAERFDFSQGGDNPIFPGMFDAALWSTGASLTAAELLLAGEAEAAASFSGGLHHAMPSRASGFCIFNDPVIAIQRLLKEGLRVAYVDIDCHHGDGVQFAFYQTDQVLTISLHESGQYLFPGTGSPEETGLGPGRGYSVNVPLFPYTDDETYLWAFRQVVPPLVARFQPDVLVTQLGIDTHFQDPITHLQLTVQGYGQVVQELKKLSPGRWLALGGGGYHIPAVIRGWALAYGVALGCEWPDELPAAFQERHSLKTLRDPEPPQIEPGLRRDARRYAEESLGQVRRLVFPIHGLLGLG
jgi:acetoin utilization protein AcuC